MDTEFKSSDIEKFILKPKIAKLLQFFMDFKHPSNYTINALHEQFNYSKSTITKYVEKLCQMDVIYSKYIFIKDSNNKILRPCKAYYINPDLKRNVEEILNSCGINN